MDNFGVDSKDVKIRGVDPKSHGSFDRFMDRATTFLRIYGSKALIIFMLSGCTTGVIDVIVKTSEAGETSALSGDSTKTPESPTAVATGMPTATATEMPTPTKEKSLIEGNIFFDPQSKEDFKKVVLSPSPIDEPEKFALWREDYLKLVNEKLINYNGPSLTTENMLIGYNYNELFLSSGEWPVVASYIFDYQGEKILTKTFVFKDGNTNLLVPLSATFSSENSLYFNDDYKTHRTGVIEDMMLIYDYGQFLRDLDKKSFTTEPFMEAFFGDFMSGEEYDAFVRVLFGEANKEDLESFSRQPFVLMCVSKRP